MRSPDSLREELQELASVIEAYGSREVVAEFPGAFADFELLERRRVHLVSQLADAEISALTVLLEGPSVVGTGTVHADFLADTLGPLQEAISSIGQSLMDRPTDRAPIPSAVRAATQLRVVGTFSGSFGLALAGPAAEQENFLALIDEEDEASRPVFERSVALVLDVIEKTEASLSGGSTNEEILAILAGIGSRAHAHLKSLAQNFAGTDAAARFTFTPPTSDQRTVTLRRGGADRLRRVLDETTIEEDEVQYVGRLAGASTIRDNFELEMSDETVLRGKVDEALLPQLRDYFDTECTVVLRVRTATSTVDNTKAVSYTLISIRS